MGCLLLKFFADILRVGTKKDLVVVVILVPDPAVFITVAQALNTKRHFTVEVET